MALALVVDDDELIRQLFMEVLRMAGLESQAASSAKDAIAMLENLTPDIAFIDYNMPGGTGIEVIQFIRSTPRLASLKIVIVTANSQVESTFEAMGIDLFLEKPVAP